MNTDAKLNLKDAIQDLKAEHMKCVFKILKKHDSDITVNKIGVFFDLQKLSDACIADIDVYIRGIIL